MQCENKTHCGGEAQATRYVVFKDDGCEEGVNMLLVCEADFVAMLRSFVHPTAKENNLITAGTI